MKKYFFFLKIIILIFFFQSQTSLAKENKILISIDNKIVTSYELENKILTILFLSNQELSQSNINNAKAMAINSLISYKLKKMELENFNKKFNNRQQISDHLKQLSLRLSSSPRNLEDIFYKQNLDYDLYIQEIEIEYSWQQYIFSRYRNKIDIDKNEVNEELDRFLKKESNIEKFNLAEIEIVSGNEDDNIKKIEEIKNRIKLNGFEDTAIKFSQSPSSLDGGSIGWINSKSFSKNILRSIKLLSIGGVTEPIYQTNSIVFFKLLDKKKEKLSAINIQEVKKQIIDRKASELLDIYSNNYLSKIKNSAFIEFK
tara:strand:- start:1011 stop:1952 length:942 start_codon:yes stop_codon:yes gene_type:complete